MSEKKVHLTSSEIASLWTDYMNSSMVKGMAGFMLRHLEDPDIRPVIQYTFDMSVSNLEQLLTIFETYYNGWYR